MILATLLTWTLLAQTTGGFSGPSQAGQWPGAAPGDPTEVARRAHELFVAELGDPAEVVRRAHTLVIAEVTAMTPVDAGGAGLGWCDLKVATALKGDAATVDGKRLGYGAGRGKLAPTVGQPCLLAIGRDHDRDVILDVKPATVATIQAATRAEDNRRAIQAGAARRVPGGNLSIAEAAAKAHTVVVGEVLIGAEVGAGGVGGAASILKVTSTLKGAARPGDRLGAGYQPPASGIAPQVGESFLAFIGKSDQQDIDVAVKLLPATAANIQAARDQTQAAGPPVATR